VNSKSAPNSVALHGNAGGQETMNQRCTNIAARRALYADESGKQAKFSRDIGASLKIQFSSLCCVAHKKLLLTYQPYVAAQFFARALPSLEN
jgi:hypothetical protein